MMDNICPVECSALILINDGQVLAEKRKLSKLVLPGAVALPGGHLESGETPEDAARREIYEELEIVPLDMVYVCTLLHRSQEFCKLHYFALTTWQGMIVSREAESIVWIPLDALYLLDVDVDKIAMSEYARIYTR